MFLYHLDISDAAKRKALPLWIREGLEKMEREKQKQLEKEQLKQQRDAMLEEGHKKRKAADDAHPSRSKFVSSSEFKSKMKTRPSRDVACFQTKAMFINTTRKRQDTRSFNKITDCLIGPLKLALDGEKL